ncbi:MAG: 4Fe-4S binding protein [Clostridiales Family XIII bacterium]|jgi:formate hydrogenlyase subunit 6/NADH:ubiquinone oxidoreductase subunit I|nr:4Fe-4S binding protein [Clostridiales Family XIII bacterium]
MAILKIGKMVMGSLFKKPATLMYPVVPRKWQERTRGHIDIAIEDCILCGICARKCPTNAITVAKETKSWTIRRMQCIQCSCCVEVCPKKCLDNKNEYTTPSTEKLVDSFEKPAAEAAPAGELRAAPDGAAASAGAATPAPVPADGTLKCGDTCIYCGICAKKCPQEALTVSRKKKNAQTGEQEGENIWSVDAENCILCGICVEVCPKKSLAIE